MEANGGGRMSAAGSERKRGQWPEAARFAPLSVYVELRDELWSDFARADFDSKNNEQALRALALLHLANKIVAALLGDVQQENR